VFRQAIDLSASLRWASFAEQPDVRENAVAAVEAVGRVVGATAALYLPDNAFPASGAHSLLYMDTDSRRFGRGSPSTRDRQRRRRSRSPASAGTVSRSVDIFCNGSADTHDHLD
jgi:hypothetical protein